MHELRNIIYLGTIVLVLHVPVGAQTIPIAVMEFEALGISSLEARALTNRLRNELFRQGNYQIVERELVESILAEQDNQLSDCVSNECLVEIGQMIGAHQIAGGSVSRVGNTYTISARIVDVESGQVIAVSDHDEQGELDRLLTNGITRIAAQLIAQNNSNSNAASILEQPADPSYLWQWLVTGFGTGNQRDGFSAGLLNAAMPLPAGSLARRIGLWPVLVAGVGGSTRLDKAKGLVADGFYIVTAYELHWKPGSLRGIATPFAGAGAAFRSVTTYDYDIYDFKQTDGNAPIAETSGGIGVATLGIQAHRVVKTWPVVAELRWWLNLDDEGAIFTLGLGTYFR